MKATITPIEQGQYIGLALSGTFQALGWRSHFGSDPDQQRVWWQSSGSSPIGQLALNFGRFKDDKIDVLAMLRRSGAPYAMRPTDLFEALLVTSGAVTKQVDRLQRRRLVKRLPDPEHGGGFRVQLTERAVQGGRVLGGRTGVGAARRRRFSIASMTTWAVLVSEHT